MGKWFLIFALWKTVLKVEIFTGFNKFFKKFLTKVFNNQNIWQNFQNKIEWQFIKDFIAFFNHQKARRFE